MEEVSDTVNAHDSGRYDNDFEKLPRDEESTSAAESGTISPGGDAKQTEMEAVGDEPQSAGKSQLNVEEISDVLMPEPAIETDIAPGDVEGDEDAVCHGCCFMDMAKCIDPRVKELILWRDMKKSGAVFASSLVLLLSFALFSVISVIAYFCLAAITMAACFRFYRHIMATIKKTDSVNPFSKYLEMDITFPEDMTDRYGDMVAKHVTVVVDKFRRVFFVDDAIETLKFALIFWVMTFIGGWFNGMTLLIVGDVLLFTLPKVYDVYGTQIDEAAGVVCDKVRKIRAQLEEKIPLLAKLKQE